MRYFTTAIFDRSIFILGIIVPFVLILIYPQYYHNFDNTCFLRYVNDCPNLFHIYNSETGCNYPVVGMLGSTIFLKIFSSSLTAHRLGLALFDAGIVIILYRIFTLLSVKRALFWSGLIGLLPSSWAGTSFWGQVDNIGQFFMILLLWYILQYIINQRSENKRHFTFFFVCGVLLSLVFLEKQVTYFSVSSLGIFIIFTAFLMKNSIKHLLALIGILLAGFVVPIIVGDLLFAPKPIYFSNIQQILLTGSSHMKKISGNGFNIWMFLNRDMNSSSDIPFYKGLTPRNTGTFLFVLYYITVTVFLIRKALKSKVIDSNIFLIFVVHLAMINLSFNILLSGTHERYLVHFFPFIFIFLIAYKDNYKHILQVGIYGAIFFGVFELFLLVKPLYREAHLIIAAFLLLFFAQMNYYLFKQFK